MEEIERMAIEHKYRIEEIEAITKLLNNTQKSNIAEEEYVNSETNARLGLSTKSSSSANNQKLFNESVNEKSLYSYLDKKVLIKKDGFFRKLNPFRKKKNNNPENLNTLSGISLEKVRIDKIVPNESTFTSPEISEDNLVFLDFPNMNVNKCPLCGFKTMKSKVKKDKESQKFYQFIKCSNVECDFKKRIHIPIA